MFGHLPLLHRVGISVVGVLAFAFVGAWLAWSTPVPLVWSVGAVAGALLGVAGVAAFLHSLSPAPTPVPARARRR